MVTLQNLIWSEKYRPRNMSDVIIPQTYKNMFEEFIKTRNIPNLLLIGKPGTGKTTVARAMLETMGCDYIVINGSLNGNIDVLRNDILAYASSVSLNPGRKYIILDEADYLPPHSTQPALRNFMEEYSRNCGFILTANFKTKIIPPLISRCSTVEFDFTEEETSKLASKFLKRVCFILDSEQVPYEKEVLVYMIKKYMPDWRKLLNELQKYSSMHKRIDSGILTHEQNIKFSELIEQLKSKNFDQIQKWCMETEFDTVSFFRNFYDELKPALTKRSVPALVVLIGEYQYKASFVADQQLNILAFLVEVMLRMEFA